MSENTIIGNQAKYITRTGKVLYGTPTNPVKGLENTLNELSEKGFAPINITQHFVNGEGWFYSLVAKR